MILIASGRPDIFRLIVIAFLFSVAIQAQEDSLPYDQTARQIIQIDSLQLAHYRELDLRFNYTHDLREEISLWDLFWSWLRSLFPEQVESIERGFWQLFIYGVMAIGLVLIILQLAGFHLQTVFKSDSKLADNILQFTDDIQSVDIDRHIRNFEADGNYHEALRFRFLALLKWLDKKKRIDWKIDKTNYEYLAEMKYTPLFSDIIRKVERVCYGDFPIGKDDYQSECERFDQFISSLGKR